MFSFLLQPTRSHRPRRQSKPNIATFFLFIISPFRELLVRFLKLVNPECADRVPSRQQRLQNLIFYCEPPPPARCEGALACLDLAGL